jgi:TonB family protein
MPTQATPTVPNEARRQAELEALRQQMSAAAAELERVRQQRAEVQANQVRQEMALLREAAAARLTELQQALRTAATRHDVGLADEQAVVAARAQVAEAERELTLAHVQADAFELSTKLEAQRGQAEREFQRAQDLYAAAQATSEASPQAVAPAGTAEQKIYRLHEGITPPTLQRRVEPEYPPLAKAARMQGPVYVDAVIGRDGRVRDAKATGGAPFPPLREAAVAAVREWEYTPTILNGAPVEVQLSVQVVFKLDGNSAPRAPAVPVQTNAFPVEDATAQVRVGDLLVIDIAGENQLPRWYIVEAGGIVRLPLIGRLQVENQTASQVRDTIAAALATRQLAQGKAVTVVIHRGK